MRLSLPAQIPGAALGWFFSISQRLTQSGCPLLSFCLFLCQLPGLAFQVGKLFNEGLLAFEFRQATSQTLQLGTRFAGVFTQSLQLFQQLADRLNAFGTGLDEQFNFLLLLPWVLQIRKTPPRRGAVLTGL